MQLDLHSPALTLFALFTSKSCPAFAVWRAVGVNARAAVDAFQFAFYSSAISRF